MKKEVRKVLRKGREMVKDAAKSETGKQIIREEKKVAAKVLSKAARDLRKEAQKS